MSVYMGFGAGISNEEAIRLFKRRWGHSPVRVIRTRGGVSVGPIGVRPDPERVGKKKPPASCI